MFNEACGVFGIYGHDCDVARKAYFGLYALQHRGQESAGIATSDGKAIRLHKKLGLVSQVFNECDISSLKGFAAIGHTRYSTTGGNTYNNTQPLVVETIYGPLGVAHNGNLTNSNELRKMLMRRGVGLMSTTDTELILQIISAPLETWNKAIQKIASTDDDWWIRHIKVLMYLAKGAYSLVILTRNSIYAVRDKLGFRPLCIGKLGKGFVVASETCALDTIGAECIREIEPGEIVRIDNEGLYSVKSKQSKCAFCIFEYIYFSRPDSQLENQSVHFIRQQLGRQLAKETNVDADIVIAVPASGIPAAIGYSQASGIPYTEGLIKNRYIGRTFICPDDELRKQGIKLKFNPLACNLKGKRIVVVDDSIVRGNTIKALIKLFKNAGATEVHIRISSPPIKFPCFMGIATPTFNELIAHKHNTNEICEMIGADSLEYLSLEGMLEVINKSTYCTACFTGEYPK